MQDVRQKNHLERKRKDRRDIEVVLTGDKTDYSGADGKEEPLPCKKMDQPIHPALHQHAEGGEEHERRQKTVYLCRNLKVHVTPK